MNKRFLKCTRKDAPVHGGLVRALGEERGELPQERLPRGAIRRGGGLGCVVSHHIMAYRIHTISHHIQSSAIMSYLNNMGFL